MRADLDEQRRPDVADEARRLGRRAEREAARARHEVDGREPLIHGRQQPVEPCMNTTPANGPLPEGTTTNPGTHPPRGDR